MENIIDVVMALKNVSIFKNIPEHILADIAGIIHIDTIPAGEQFIRKDEMGDEMYIIRNGQAQIHDGDHKIAVLEKNQIVGELAILAPVTRTADVTAISDLLVFVINRDYFLDLMDDQPDLVKGVMGALVRKIIETNEKLKSGS